MNHLFFAEAFFCWHLANYGISTDPLRDDERDPSASDRRWRWIVLLRSLTASVLLVASAGFHQSVIAVGMTILIGSLLVPPIRRKIPISFLVEFELAVNGLTAFFLWAASAHAGIEPSNLKWIPLQPGQIAALAVCAALFLYLIRGGNYLVRGILKKAGGLPDAAEPRFEGQEGYAHGRMIGQIERIIVVLVVIAGNLSALAFFFAAKGLIRSKELEERPRADYFLLGSLASFLVAVAAGMVLQKVLAAWW